MRHLAAFLVVVFASLLSAAPAARADAEGEARERYERAVKFYEEGAFDAALAELRRAYELRPSYKLLYNMAQARLALNDYAAALEAFHQYLEQGGQRVAKSRRDSVQAELARLEQRVARLTIKVDVPGAEVLVDDAPLGVTPLSSSVLVNSGSRRVSVRHPDHATQARRVSLAGGDQVEVQFALASNASALRSRAEPRTSTDAVEPSPTREPPASTPLAPLPSADRKPREVDSVPGSTRRRERIWLGLAWGTSGAIAVSAGVAAGLAYRQDRQLAEAREAPGADEADLQERSDSTRRWAIAADTLTAAALLASGLSLWLTLRKPRGDSAPARGTARFDTAGQRAGAAVSIGFAPNAVRVNTRF